MTERPESEDVDWILGVLGHAAGSAAAQFIPVPFVDDWAVGKLLTRIAEKVLARHDVVVQPGYAAQVAKGYLDEGGSSFGRWIVVSVAKFLLRKVAIIFDVKKSHDVFGESVAFALALDVALESRMLLRAAPRGLGAAMFRSVRSSGKGALGTIAGASFTAFTSKAGDETRMARFRSAVASEVNAVRRELRAALERESMAPQTGS